MSKWLPALIGASVLVIQIDPDSGDTYSGINYGERFRGILAGRGELPAAGCIDSPPQTAKSRSW